MSAKSPPQTSGAVPHPRATAELHGHGAAEATLLRAWQSGRLPHAWLITGPRGVGKATLAYRFARFVLAGGGAGDGGLFGEAAPTDLTVDSESPTARQVASGGHPDLHVLEPGQPNPETGKISQEIVVAQVRQAVHFCFMTPAQTSWRVILVDPAEEMNVNAANALLKVLEEPPKQALLLLVSHAPARLLPTIRSRCARLALSGLDEATLRMLLARHAPDLAEADAAALVRLSEGSLGRALELAAAGGLDLYRELIGLLDGLPRLDVAALHAFGERMSQGGAAGSFRLGGELLTWWLARLIRAGAQGRLPDPVVAGEDALMGRLLDGADLEPWLELWEKTARLFARAERSHFDRKQVVLTAFLEIEALAARQLRHAS